MKHVPKGIAILIAVVILGATFLSVNYGKQPQPAVVAPVETQVTVTRVADHDDSNIVVYVVRNAKNNQEHLLVVTNRGVGLSPIR